MIADDDVTRLFRKNAVFLTNDRLKNKSLPTELYRGKAVQSWEHQHPGGCDRHLSVFDQFNVIPEYCFDCYKVLVAPRTVVELFKLMMVFERIKLPNENTRKCIVECREDISGAYKGFVYCRSLEEGAETCEKVKELVAEEISDRIPVTLKRGCSEYALRYPEYAQAVPGTKGMEYRQEWREIEDLADDSLDIKAQPPLTHAFDNPVYAAYEARIMLAWLKYAATIGDSSYLKISGRPVRPAPNMKRPPFQPPADE